MRPMLALLTLFLAATSIPAQEQVLQRSEDADRVAKTIKRFHEIDAANPFCTPSFWAWELQLAIAKKDESLARAIAQELYKLQEPDGSWALGTDWNRSEWDFKARMADDAESWEVAEAANAVLDYHEAFGDPEATRRAAKAAEYLKKNVEYVDGKPYLPHMPECNHMLQAHSTINAALLLSRVKGYEALAAQLKDAGVSMNFQRILTFRDRERLVPPKVGMEINDYEKIQIGYYLLQMGDPRGREILARYKDMNDINHPRGAAYLVIVYTRLGDHEKARHFATLQKDMKPRRGYEFALRDFIDYVFERSGA
ncbi:MAG: hypothetical protein HUU20_27010 [Pirellulales bacterium]|nr:hypothetical protein [Pirellulales bacterium]